jgi:hypothetical protein
LDSHSTQPIRKRKPKQPHRSVPWSTSSHTVGPCHGMQPGGPGGGPAPGCGSPGPGPDPPTLSSTLHFALRASGRPLHPCPRRCPLPGGTSGVRPSGSPATHPAALRGKAPLLRVSPGRCPGSRLPSPFRRAADRCGEGGRRSISPERAMGAVVVSSVVARVKPRHCFH